MNFSLKNSNTMKFVMDHKVKVKLACHSITCHTISIVVSHTNLVKNQMVW
jgi:hypothetical protein